MGWARGRVSRWVEGEKRGGGRASRWVGLVGWVGWGPVGPGLGKKWVVKRVGSSRLWKDWVGGWVGWVFGRQGFVAGWGK